MVINNCDKNKMLSHKEYLGEIKLERLINNLRQSDTRKILLAIVINLFLPTIWWEHIMHSKSDSVEMMSNDIEDEVIEEFFQ